MKFILLTTILFSLNVTGSEVTSSYLEYNSLDEVIDFTKIRSITLDNGQIININPTEIGTFEIKPRNSSEKINYRVGNGATGGGG